MFENIIEQSAAVQLKDDIQNKKHAPSMLFFGPSESGKGSSALELARALSCEKDASWKCSCQSCEKHRYLQHDDLLLLGKRNFASEITACAGVFLRNPANAGTKLMFFRSLRKLQLRFSPVIIEDDPKLGKLTSSFLSYDEKLNEFLLAANEADASLEKLCASLVKEALALDEEGISSNIPVNHIRNASYWCRLAPNGKQKTFIIENAENMRDEARNSLLKLLEEPPPSVSIVLTSQRREAIIPTLLSRMRPYRFVKRSAEGEKEVLRRVFQYTETEKTSISAYLESFLPQNSEKLQPLASWFIVSLARISAVAIKKKTGSIPPFINALGERYAQEADSAGLERTVKSSVLVKTLLSKSGNFEDDSFSRFMKIFLEKTGEVTRQLHDPLSIAYNDMFKKHAMEAVTSVDVLNISAALALEGFLHNLKTSIINAGRVKV